MATDDQQILVAGTAPTPCHFRIPGNGQITPRTIFAHFDGSAALTSFLPALKIVSDGGETIGVYPTTGSVAAGGSADLTWFPGLGGGGGGGVQALVGARIEASVTQSVTTNTNTDLVYDTVNFDTDGMANLGADARKLTVNTPGLYLLTCETVYPFNTAGRRINVISYNQFYSTGGPFPSNIYVADSRNAIWSDQANGPRTNCLSVGMFKANSGDFFASGTFQASGVNLSANGFRNTFLSALLIGEL